MSTIPTSEDARQAALARRQAIQTEHDAQLLEQRSVLYGDAQLKIEAVMETPDVDDVALLQAVNDVLDGKAPMPVPAAPATESLSDDEQELLDAFRKGRVVKTPKGAFRDNEWGTRERTPKAAEAPKPESTPVVTPEPKTAEAPKVEEKVASDKPAEESTTTQIVVEPEKKDKAPSVKERVKKRVSNLTS